MVNTQSSQETDKKLCSECGKHYHLPRWEVCFKCNEKKRDGGESVPASKEEIKTTTRINTSGLPIEMRKMFWLNALNNSVILNNSENLDLKFIEDTAYSLYDMSVNWWNGQK